MTSDSALTVAQGSFSDPQDPHKSLYDIDDANTVIQLGDWYHKVSPVRFVGPPLSAMIFFEHFSVLWASPSSTFQEMGRMATMSRYVPICIRLECEY
jgi:hypothetical protein